MNASVGSGVDDPRRWRCMVVSGPDTGRTLVVGPGVLTVGSAAPAALTIDDPAVAPLAAVLALGAAGRWRVERCDGMAGVSTGLGQVTVPLGGGALRLEPVLSIGRTLVLPSVVGGPGVGGTAGRALVRRPRAQLADVPASDDRRESPPADPDADGTAGTSLAGPLLSGAVAFVGAVVTAAWFGQPAFAMAGAVALIMSLVHASLGRRAHNRRRHAIRMRRDEYLAELVAAALEDRRRWVERRRSRVATLLERLDVAVGLATAGADGGGLWERRPADGDAFTVAAGEGPVPWEPAVRPPREMAEAFEMRWRAEVPDEQLPIGIALDPGEVVVVRGPAAAALARSMVVQLALQCGPADWALRCDLEQAVGWEWTGVLAQADDEAFPYDDDAGFGVRAGHGGGGDTAARSGAPRHSVWITDRVHDLVDPASVLRRRLVRADPPAVIVLLADTAPTPAVCTLEVVTTVDGLARLALHRTGESTSSFRLHGVGVATARAVATALGGWSDPEHAGSLIARIPTEVALGELLAAVDERGATPVDRDGLRTPLGIDASGTFWFDLVADGPHALVAGTTGSGKSELLRSLVIGLAARYSPAEVAFVLIDYKGGSAFDVCSGLAHVVGSVTDLDAGLASRALRSLRAEIVRRERVLRTVGSADLGAARHRFDEPVLARLVIVVDEFAALASELPEFLHALVGIAQRGRSLGMHLVLATQRPAGVVSDDIRANTNARIALRLNDVADALDVVGDAVPATLARHTPGRAVARLGAGELVVFQSARCGEEPSALVTRMAESTAESRAVSTTSPWCDPLPSQWMPDDDADPFDADDPPIALVDLPDEQRRDVLRWTADGHVLVVGAVGSGVTTALRTVALHAAAGGASVAPRDVLVVDALGDAAWDATAAASPAVVVVRLHERERLRRLLRRAAAARLGTEQRRVVMVVDGVGAVRRELSEIDRIDDLAALERVMLDATPDAVTVVLGTDTVGSIPAGWIARCAQRWVLRVNDPLDAVAVGASPIPGSAQPPGRGVIVPGGHEAQWACIPGAAVRRRAGVAVPTEPIGVLAEVYPSAELGQAVIDDAGWTVVVGVGFDDLRPTALEVCWGEHLLVVGAARSGRSAVLARLLEAWVSASPADAVTWSVHAPRRSPLGPWSVPIEAAVDAAERARAAGVCHLLLVDDAELVDDPSGRLLGLLQSGSGRVVVAAAGRGDALRQRFGHWTGAVRQSRLGVVMAAAADGDGDLLGASIPRRAPLAPRPGLAYLVGTDGTRLVQVGWSPLHRPAVSA